ncbi:MAG: cell division protein FtsL [Treponema sp.]|nr:cell division protein FtsL [Treponema sp.]
MLKKYLFLYFAVIAIPLMMGLCVWQSFRYQRLNLDVNRIEKTQAEFVERNKQLIADIAVQSSPERIEQIAVRELKLRRIRPEDVLQVRIEGGKGHEL